MMLTRILITVVVLLVGGTSVWLTKSKGDEITTTDSQVQRDVPRSGAVFSSNDGGSASDVELILMSERGYRNESGQYVIDLFEQEYASLTVQVETANRDPIVGVEPSFSMTGTSRLLEPADVSSQATTDETGMVEFAIVAGKMGLDQATVTFGETTVEMLVNIISLEAVGYPTPPEVEGGIKWNELMGASIQYQGEMLVADFPESVEAKAGETVKLSGFILPLEPEMRQKRFLLTSNPPSCFFHVPGGPAGAVVVLAPEGVEVSWDPVVLEGRFEPREKSSDGVVYWLHDARLVKH